MGRLYSGLAELFHINDHGGVLISHIADEDTDHSLRVVNDANAFESRSIDIMFEIDTVAGELASSIVANVDATGATGGNISAILVSGLTGDFAEIHGMAVVAGMNVIIQNSGVEGDMDSALSNAVNVLASFISAASDVEVFSNDTDTVTIGDAAQFTAIIWDLAIEASNPGVDPLFEFSTGVGTWSTFDPGDTTNQFRQSGRQSWMLSKIR